MAGGARLDFAFALWCLGGVNRFVMLGLGLMACGKAMTTPPPTPWSPGTVFRPAREANARGLVDRRGLVHAHSIHSHDACDNHPINDAGVFDEACLMDFRRDVCTAGHDFVFLTDHPTHFAEVEYPETMLFRPALGDEALLRGGKQVGNWMKCDGRDPVLILPGMEGDLMPVGLEAQTSADIATRKRTADDVSDAGIEAHRRNGAVVLVAHTENFTIDQLTTLPLDGFEMYNLHRNSFSNAALLADLLLNKYEKKDYDGLPHPDLFLSAYKLEEPTYWSSWGTVLSRGLKRVTTMGTDCHRNSFPQLMQDGERIDSYRRMMSSFSNHLLVKPNADGTIDDAALKEALKHGRLYGSFDFMGFADGFAFTATEGGANKEMGDTVSIAQGATLEVKVPSLKQLDATAPAPAIVTKLLRAKEGDWDVMATTTERSLSFTPTVPGAYRVEVRITPNHLKPFIGRRGDFIRDERPWVYSNAIYVQ